MKRLFILLLIGLATAACEKDKKGNLLSVNYLSATINGTEYIDRQPFNLWNRTTPTAEYTDYYTAADLSHLLVIKSHLTPKSEQDGQAYEVLLMIPDFEMESSWIGYKTDFRQLPEDVDLNQLAPIAYYLKEQQQAIGIIRTSDGSYTVAGTLHITDQQGEWFYADLELQSEAFTLKGLLYTFIR